MSCKLIIVNASLQVEMCTASADNGVCVAGLAGTIYFLVDLQHPSEARFPAFQL